MSAPVPQSASNGPHTQRAVGPLTRRLLLAALAGSAVVPAAARGRDAGPAGAPSTAEPPSLRMIELAIDAPLTEAERAAVLGFEQRFERRDPAASRRDRAQGVDFLRRYERAAIGTRAQMRHRVRARMHSTSREPDPTWWDIVARRDPVLVTDVPRQEVVTVADLRAMAASNAFFGRLLGIRSPDPGNGRDKGNGRISPEDMRALQVEYARDEAVREQLLMARLRNVVVQFAWPLLPAPTQAQLLQLMRDEVHTPAEVAAAARIVETEVVQAGFKHNRAQRAAALANFRRTMNAGVSASIAAFRITTQTLTIVRGYGY